MTRGPHRPTAVGMFLGLCGLYAAGCASAGPDEADGKEHTRPVHTIVDTSWRLRVKEQTEMRVGERLRWKSQWGHCDLDVRWKSLTGPKPFDIHCEGSECRSTSPADEPGVFRYQVRTSCPPDGPSLQLDPDVVVMEAQ